MLFPVHMPHDLDKTFYLIKWVSSVIALQDHKNFPMTVKQRKYDKTSECFLKKSGNFPWLLAALT